MSEYIKYFQDINSGSTSSIGYKWAILQEVGVEKIFIKALNGKGLSIEVIGIFFILRELWIIYKTKPSAKVLINKNMPTIILGLLAVFAGAFTNIFFQF